MVPSSLPETNVSPLGLPYIEKHIFVFNKFCMT
jgi:hypothetical protein